jgi:nitric oxide reductase NorD protein
VSSAGLLRVIQRRFELLRARRARLRKQLEGEEIDLEACVEAAADFRAGLPRSERLYQTLRPARREMAIALLVDASGSTDSWVSGSRRVIDVEREALLLVCIALEAMRERYTVQSFSGEGPGMVTVRQLKGFDEHHGEDVSRRIAGLEPERYTRVGAALRHVSGMLMREPARHRLLLLLSDGKPNDVDHYEGRYGVEDMRQAVTEAKLQGIHPFCLTVDRAAASYLPDVFGASEYALLPRPELLPSALLDWIRRLASE